MKESGNALGQSKTAQVPEEKRATEYLANERTFLAWIRTSIAVVSMGFAITRLGPVWSAFMRRKLNSWNSSFIMGTALMALGALLAVLAVWRYHIVNRAIENGQVKADRGLVLLVTFLVICLSVGMIVFMFTAE
jgi:putative membrane protein